ncbi:MAG: oligosaccharide flippase family protein [Rhodopila sp.]
MRRSLAWIAAEISGSMGVTMITMLLMARLMTPEQFGTGALVLGGVAFISLYVGGFFHDALIQRANIGDDAFEASLTVTVLAGLAVVALATLAAILAPAGGSWSRVGWLFVAASLALPFGGMLGVVSARMRRDLLFSEIAQSSLVGRLTGCTIGLGMAHGGFGAVSLVAQAVSDIALQSVMLMARSRWRPKPSLNVAELVTLCRFALPNAIVHSIAAARLQGYLLMITGFASLTATGFVNVAFRITYTPQIILATNFTNFALPILARYQSASPKMEEAFRLVTRLVLSVTVPIFIGLALVADDVVPLLLGREWISIVQPVQIMAVGVAIIFLRFPASLVLKALGNVRLSLLSNLFQTTVVLLGMAVLQPQDLSAVVALWVLPSIVQLPVALIVAKCVSRLSWRAIAIDFLPIFVSILAMTITVTALAGIADTKPSPVRLASRIAFGAGAYAVTLLLTDHWIRDQLINLVRRMRCALGGVS